MGAWLSPGLDSSGVVSLMGRLTEDLLTLARADSGRLAARVENVDLLGATRQAVVRYGSHSGRATHARTRLVE